MVSYINKLKELDAEIQQLIHIRALLEWDQETYMPARAVDERAEQIGIIEGIIHRKIIAPEFGEILAKLDANQSNPTGSLTISAEHKGYVRAVFRRYTRNHQLPEDFIIELARQGSLAQAKWLSARELNDFSRFKPNLKKIVNLLRQKAILTGYSENIYDALLDEYEPWMKTTELDQIFREFHPRLLGLYHRIRASGQQPPQAALQGPFDTDKQREFGHMILQKMGFDFQRGRLDPSVHPFTTSLGNSDIRLTNHYTPHLPCSGLFGVLHEGGHGLYELGFSREIHNTLLANAPSVALHESQSRLWENIIGKGLPFWQAFYPQFRELFSGQLGAVSLETFYKAMNRVEASPIRVEADEVTYNLHIFLRYNLEKRLINGDLTVAELPAAWREESKSLLGIIPEDDNQGVLQDIHWATGALGYFPTYSLGNLYSAQFYSSLRRELPGLDKELAGGNLFPVFNWLREKIHIHGSVYTAGELCKKVTGEPLSPDHYIRYLEEKFESIYEL